MADWQLCVDLRINSIFYELTLFLRRNYGLYKTIFVRVRCFQFNALLLLRAKRSIRALVNTSSVSLGTGQARQLQSLKRNNVLDCRQT